MNPFFAIFDLGGTQIFIILALILVFFGAKRIPDLAKGLGQGIREFKKATREVTDEIHNTPTTPTPKAPAAPTTPQNQQPPAGPETKVI